MNYYDVLIDNTIAKEQTQQCFPSHYHWEPHLLTVKRGAYIHHVPVEFGFHRNTHEIHYVRTNSNLEIGGTPL